MIEVKEGQEVYRYLCGTIEMPLLVSQVDSLYIHCGPWKFLKENGNEVDEDLDWDGLTKTGSFILPTRISK